MAFICFLKANCKYMYGSHRFTYSIRNLRKYHAHLYVSGGTYKFNVESSAQVPQLKLRKVRGARAVLTKTTKNELTICLAREYIAQRQSGSKHVFKPWETRALSSRSDGQRTHTAAGKKNKGSSKFL